MPRRLLLLFLCWLSTTPTLSVATEPASKPNVIFILLDDMGWGDLGVLHQNLSAHPKRHQTPMLDAMAAEGMQLRAHYCPAPVCAPSRSSLFSGVHQGHAEVRDNQFDKALADNHTLATVMKAAGYRTWLVGKYGLQGATNGQDDDFTPKDWPAYPTKRGFDAFYGYVRHRDGHLHYPAHEWPLGDSPAHRTPKQVWHNDREVSSELAGCYTTDLFAARSKDWIIDHVRKNQRDPFFLYLAFDTPHAALQLPAVSFPAGTGLTGGLQWTNEPGRMINTAGGTIDSYRHPDYTGRGWTDAEERFATMVRRIDTAVGDLLQTLRDLGIDENTMVVLSSDNGPHHEAYLQNARYTPESFQSYGPFDGTKRDVWEGGIRVGTLAWWPGTIPAGTTSDRPSQFHDWMPTFAAAAGNPPPARTDGVSLLPTLTRTAGQRDGQVYVEYVQGGRTPAYQDFDPHKRGRKRGQMQVVFLDGYKGVRLDIENHQTPFAIYDLAADPKEQHDLAGTAPQFVELQQRMHDRVLQIRRPNPSAPRPYDKTPIPAIATSQQEGWLVETFTGPFPYVPDVAECKVATSTRSDNLTAEAVGGAVRFSGIFVAEQTGLYKATLTTPTRAFVRIHDAALIDADHGFHAGDDYVTTVRLEAGLHPVRVTALAEGDVSLELDFQLQ
jgi:arylsulfatase A-like enzyme